MNHCRLALLAALTVASAPHETCARDGCARTNDYSLTLLDESLRPLPTFDHQGRTYVLGKQGERYLLLVKNRTARGIEVVASVDGRDVIDGKPSALPKRGYLVSPYGELTIDGFRLSGSAVAAFRFSSVENSYAARMGDALDVGVIGVAVFPEAEPRPKPREELAYGDAAGKKAEGAPFAAPQRSSDGASASSSSAAREERRKGLGTEFGEEHPSQVEEVAFERASSRPSSVLSLRYDDRPGLLALGIDVDVGRALSSRDRLLRDRAEPFRRDDRYAEPPFGWPGR